MDLVFLYQGQRFVWNSEKASSNFSKHGVSFEKACQVFFDPFVRIEDAGSGESGESGKELRNAAIGLTEDWSMLFVVHILRAKAIRFASSQRVRQRRRNGDRMKTVSERLQQRFKKSRQMTTISIRMPEDVIEDLREIAPSLGFSGYQPLIRAYIGQGLRRDQVEVEHSQVQVITDSLRKQGVADQVISNAIAEARRKTA